MSRAPAKPTDVNAWQTQCGPLQGFLQDESITEIMVNGPTRIYVEQKGLIKRTQARFNSEEDLLSLMQAMAASIGKTLDEKNPCVDARLPDGSRINCVIPPVAVDGPALTIRKFSNGALNHEQLIEVGTMDDRIAFFLNCCVMARMNIVVSGGTGSGKTTLLNVLSSFVPSHERIVSIEDAAELKIRVDNLVRLESRPVSSDGPAVTTRQLVINALRMRPDRIVVGECRGSEALDMLVAMNTGHEGSMTTVHANSARDALRRLETMVLLAGTEMPLRVVRENIARAVDLIVQIQRQPDGTRRVVEVMEVSKNMEGDTLLTQDIFMFDRAKGVFRSAGFVPSFLQRFQERGVSFPPDFFADLYKVTRSKG